MKYFNIINESFFDYAFNLECGTMVAKNGEITDNTEKTIEINLNNIKTYIKYDRAYIFISQDFLDDFIKLFSEKMKILSNKYEAKYGEHHLNKSRQIHNINPMLSIKAKSLTKHDSENPNVVNRRLILHDSFVNKFKTYYKMFTNIFTWFIVDISKFISLLEKKNSLVDYEYYDSIIVYDSKKIFNITNNTNLMITKNNLFLSDMILDKTLNFSNYMCSEIMFYGLTNEIDSIRLIDFSIQSIKTKNADKCSLCNSLIYDIYGEKDNETICLICMLSRFENSDKFEVYKSNRTFLEILDQSNLDINIKQIILEFNKNSFKSYLVKNNYIIETDNYFGYSGPLYKLIFLNTKNKKIFYIKYVNNF